MPVGWDVRKLGDVCDVRDGTHDSPKYINKGFALITSKNLKNDNLTYDKVKYISEEDYVNINKRSKVDIGDILFAMIGTIGNPIVIKDKPLFAIKNVALFKVSKNHDSYFLKYYLDSPNVIQSMSKDAKGATQKFVGLGYLRGFKIPLPPLPEQKRIVAILDKAFTAINKAKANTEQNLKNARELFQSKLQETFDNGKLKIKNGEWEEKTLGEVCEYDKKKNTQKNLPYVGLENIESNTGKFLGSKEPFQVKSSTFHFSVEHMLYGRLRPYLNKILVPEFSGHCSTEIFPIKTNKLIIRKFLFYWFMTKKTVAKIDATWTGARMPRANMTEVINFRIVIPSIKEQNLIVKKLNAISTEAKKLETIYQQKINGLNELKKNILQKAFNGEL